MKSINLIPEEFVVRETIVRHVIGWAIGITLAVSGIAGGAWWQHSALAADRSEVETMNETADAVQDLREKLTGLVEERAELDKRIDNVNSLIGHCSCAKLLADVAEHISENLVLTLFALEGNTTQVEQPTSRNLSRREAKHEPEENHQRKRPDNQSVLKLKGWVLSDIELTRFISGLRENEIIGDVQLVYAKHPPQRPNGLKTFELRCTLDDEKKTQ